VTRFPRKLKSQRVKDRASLRGRRRKDAGEISALRMEAESQATQIRAQGEARAAESLAVFKQNPALANFIFELDALKDSLKERATLVLDQNTPPFNLLTGVSTNLLMNRH
jgi:regulator of protease activity HflC (stomatin/prohibitin superfamily)